MQDNNRPGLYIGLFCVSFVFFLYLTFPYGVLKEAVIAEISKVTDYNIRVKELGPSLLLGFDAEDITIGSKDGAYEVEIDELDLNVNILPLLIGRASVDVTIYSKDGGSLDLLASWSLYKMLMHQNFIPKIVELEAENFDVGALGSFGLQVYSQVANELIRGTLAKIKIAGRLNGSLEIDLDVDDPTASSGEVNLSLVKAFLDLNDKNLGVPKQDFKKAVIQASLLKGALKIAPASGFVTQELSIDPKGSAEFRAPIAKSRLNLGVDVKISGKIRENFDFLLNMAGGKDGMIAYNLSGTLDRPIFKSQ